MTPANSVRPAVALPPGEPDAVARTPEHHRRAWAVIEGGRGFHAALVRPAPSSVAPNKNTHFGDALA